MNAPDSFADLTRRLGAGDPDAAAEVYARYARRLIGLARRQLDERIRTKVDEDDIAQSVFRTFFRRHAQRPFDLDSEDALWALLAEITLRKCGKWHQHFNTRTRRVGLESPYAGDESWVDEPADPAAPTPEDAASLRETTEQLLQGLDERERQVCELRLEGYEVREIAEKVGWTQVTVQRKIRRIK